MSDEGSEEIPEFFKFYHSRKSSKIHRKENSSKKSTGPPKTKERSAGNCPTLQTVSRTSDQFDVFDAAQVGRQSKGSIAA